MNEHQQWLQRLNDYVRWRGDVGQAPTTLETVRSVLRLWIPWALEHGIDPGEFDDAAIQAFCISRDGINSRKRGAYAGHIRRWREGLHEFERASRSVADASSCWVVRAGREGEAVEHNLANDVVTISWGGFGEFESVVQHESRDEFRDFLIEELPDWGPPDWPEKGRRSACDQIWRFAREIECGDFVVMPMKGMGPDGKSLAIGRVAGPYAFDPAQPDYLRQRRSVAWLRRGIERKAIGEDLRNSLGVPLTVFGLRHHDAPRRIRHLAEHGVDPGP